MRDVLQLGPVQHVPGPGMLLHEPAVPGVTAMDGAFVAPEDLLDVAETGLDQGLGLAGRLIRDLPSVSCRDLRELGGELRPGGRGTQAGEVERPDHERVVLLPGRPHEAVRRNAAGPPGDVQDEFPAEDTRSVFITHYSFPFPRRGSCQVCTSVIPFARER